MAPRPMPRLSLEMGLRPNPGQGQGPGSVCEGAWCSKVPGMFPGGEGAMQEQQDQGLIPGLQTTATSSFYALRHIVWLTCAFLIYVCAVVLTVLGVKDIVKGLNEIYYAAIYQQIFNGVVAVLIIFGVVEVLLIFMVIFTRSHEIIKCCFNFRLPNPISRFKSANTVGFTSQAIICGFIVVEINVCTALFAVGFSLWILQYLFHYTCTTAFSALFTVTNGLAADVCVNLGMVGLPLGSICGYDLANLCSKWQHYRIQYVVIGAYLFMLSHIMFLGGMTHNIHMLRMKPASGPTEAIKAEGT